jgi:hypothetical protein
MRKVMVLGWSDDAVSPVKVDRGEATFHGFTTDSCIDEGQLLTYPAAIVEWPSGEVTSLYVDFIRFLDAPI